MWWSDRRSLGLRVWALLLLAGLSACEVRPLYSQRVGNGSNRQELQQVRILPIPNRSGQMLHNFLRDEVNPGGQPVDPAYALRVTLSEQTLEVGVQKDETATRANLRVIANFQLLNTASGAQELVGRSSFLVSYNLLTQPYATYAAEEDARRRALLTVSRDIATRLTAHFENRRTAVTSQAKS